MPFVYVDSYVSVHDELRVELHPGERPGSYRLYAAYVPPPGEDSNPKIELPVTEPDVDFPFKPDEMRKGLSELTSIARARATTSAPLTDIQHLGALLFDRLLVRSVRRTYMRVRERAESRKRGFRLRLAFPPSRPGDDIAAVENLPWEALYDPDRKDFVALCPGTSVVRTRLPLSRPIVPSSGPPMILAVATEISDNVMEAYGSDAEVEILTRMAKSHGIHVQPLHRPSEETFLREVASTTAQVVHFSGTAEDESLEPVLLFPLHDGELLGPTPRRVPIAKIAEALKSAPNVQLVFISGCDSLDAASALLEAVPAVVGFRDRGMSAAFTEVVRAFYDRLVSGDSLDVALAESRKRADRSMPGQAFWTQEVLYLSSPSGDWVWPRKGDRRQPDPDFVRDPGPSPPVVKDTPEVLIARERRRILAANREELEKRRQRLQEAFKSVPDFLTTQLDETTKALAAVDAELAKGAAPVPGGP